MPRIPAVALLLALLLAPTAGLLAEEDVLTVHLDWEPRTVGAAKAGRIPFKGDPPAGVEPLPDLRAARYARIRMAGSEKGLLLAFDADASNPRLWVDHDFDGDLKDEKSSSMTQSGSYWRRNQTILAPFEDESVPVPIPLVFTHIPQKGVDYVTVYARISRRGMVVLGGRLRHCALGDHSFDAAFDDKRDRIYIDLDGDLRYQIRDEDPECIEPGVPFRVGDEGWTAHIVSRSGHALEFRRSKTVPPARPRTWTDTTPQAAGITRPKPSAPFDDLRARFEAERKKPYAERTATVTQLGYVGSKASFDFLMDVASSDADINIRSAAIRALGNKAYLEIGGDQVLALAKKAKQGQAYAAAQALHEMGHPDRERVYLAMIDSADNNAVSGSARYLAFLESKQGRERILHHVREHGTPSVRYTTYVNGARNLRGGPPVELMLAASKDGYPQLEAAAIEDLATLGRPEARKRAMALAEVRPVNVTVGMALARVLGGQGDGKAVKAMLGLFEDEKLHANVRKIVIEQLRFLRAPDAIAALMKGLKGKIPAVRGIAAEVLAGIPDPKVTKALLSQAKKEKDADVLPLLLEALGDHGDTAAMSLLLKHAKKRKVGAAQSSAMRGLARLGFHHPKVRAFLLAQLASRSDASRILALDAAAASGDASVVPKVLPNLEHDAWQVRLAAVEALDALRPLAAIEPLIARLETEEEERVRDAIAAALFRLTGMNLYDDHKIWARWWAEHEKGFEVPKDIPTMPEEHAGGTQAGFYGIPVKSNRIVFVIDQSGSMSAAGMQKREDDDEDAPRNRLDVAVREVLGAVAKLKNRARVNVILFHTTIHPWKPTLQRLSGGNRSALERHLTSKKPTGGTNLYDGLELALRMPDVDTIFLLSDGAPGAGKYVATPDILRAVRRENQTRRIAIHCVSIGMDSDLMKKIARENGGRYARR